jgi:exonuclease SbcC
MAAESSKSKLESIEMPVEMPAEAKADEQAAELKSTPAVKPDKDAAVENPAELVKAPVSKPAEPNVPSEMASLESQLPSLSFKNTVPLVTFENKLNRVRKFIDTADETMLKKAEALRGELQARFAENQEHQKNLSTETKDLVAQMEKAIEDGQSQIALSTWDKIQANFNNTTGEVKQALQDLFTPFKAKITELRDWRIFAATEKKKELVQQMEKLAETEMHAADKSSHINKLHKEFKKLGRSNQNDELWQQFKQASDKASEPCKDYFKQRKQELVNNFNARKELCAELEKQIETFKVSEPELGLLNKILKQADENWQKHAPVDRNKIKPLQKRFYSVVNKLRKVRKSIVRKNAQAKMALIAQAEELLKTEDRQEAMNTAKQLQQDWKKIGAGSYKEDRKHWEKFRSICDEIFSASNKNQASRSSDNSKPDNKKVRDEAQPVLKDLESLLKLTDEALREQRKQYQQLQQNFTAALDQLPGKQRGKVRDQFNGLKRRLDTRFKVLPDKKTQAQLEQLQRCDAYLSDLETRMLAGKETDIAGLQDAIDDTQWQELTKGIDEECGKLLQERMQNLRSYGKPADARSAADKAETAFRELCIQAEIRANASSPEEDQPRRMELQLAQLQQKFGHAQQDQAENTKFVQRSRLTSHCLGPIEINEKTALADRLEKNLQRLF